MSAHFHLAMMAASISHFVTATKFLCCPSNKKKCLLRVFISRSKSLSPFFSLSFAGLPPTFSFSLSFSCFIFQICGHDNIYLSLILQTTLIHKQFSLSVFVFIDSFVVSTLQDAGGYAISRENNLELHLGWHICWLSYFTLVCLWCGRTVSRAVYGHVITKFSRMGRLLHFLTHGAPLARFARESPAKKRVLAHFKISQGTLFEISNTFQAIVYDYEHSLLFCWVCCASKKNKISEK